MDAFIQPSLRFLGVQIVNVNVNMLKPYDQSKEQPININITPKVFYPEDNPNNFVIVVDSKVASQDFFEISVTAFGHFTINKQVTDPDAKPFININAPAIVFPYVRSFLTTLTANMGGDFPLIIIPPHIFKGEMEEVENPDSSTTNI